MADLLNKIGALREQLTDTSRSLEERAKTDISFFDWNISFSDVFAKGGFDIVIGNPPYIRQEKLEPEYKKILISQYPNVGVGTADILVYFFGLAINVLKDDGALSFITSNKFLKTKYGLGLRNTLSSQTDVLYFIDFFELPVFHNASTDAGITLLLKRDPISSTKYFPVKTLENLNLDKISSGPYLETIKNATEWQFVQPEEKSILGKIAENSITLKEFVNDRIYSGLKTGANETFMLSLSKRQEILDDCNSVDEYNRTDVLIKNAFRSRDIRQYKYTGPERWLLFIPWHFPLPFDEAERMKPEEAILQAERKLKNEYPSLYKYLLTNKEILADRNAEETGIRYEWYALQRWGAKYYREFDENKLIYIHTAKKHEFYYDSEGHFVNNSCYIIVSQSKFLYWFLNSKLFEYFKKIKFVAYGDGAEDGRCKLDGNKMATVPIKMNVDETPFEEIYNKVQEKLRGNPNADIKTEEKYINNLIFDLYGLTEEEKEIIRKS